MIWTLKAHVMVDAYGHGGGKAEGICMRMTLVCGTCINTRDSYGLTLQIMLNGRALLAPGVDNRVVVVRDDELTSVIAYFLSSQCAPLFRCTKCIQSHCLRMPTVTLGLMMTSQGDSDNTCKLCPYLCYDHGVRCNTHVFKGYGYQNDEGPQNTDMG